MSKRLIGTFIALLFLCTWVYLEDLPFRTPKPLPFITMEGLPDSEPFTLMENGDVGDVIFRSVVRSPIDWAPAVEDDRIYNRHLAIQLYQHHCYRFFADESRKMDDMKIGFLNAFLHEYHGLEHAHIDRLAYLADTAR